LIKPTEWKPPCLFRSVCVRNGKLRQHYEGQKWKRYKTVVQRAADLEWCAGDGLRSFRSLLVRPRGHKHGRGQGTARRSNLDKDAPDDVRALPRRPRAVSFLGGNDYHNSFSGRNTLGRTGVLSTARATRGTTTSAQSQPMLAHPFPFPAFRNKCGRAFLFSGLYSTGNLRVKLMGAR
jgi:hypothetical protein